MEIQPISNSKFFVGLSKTDMAELDITYEEMDYSNIDTRRVIWTILDTVRQRIGRDVDPSGNLMIEAAPDIGGGCLLLFTVPPICIKATGTVISKSEAFQIFEFLNVDNLLDIIKIIGKDGVIGRIFTDGKKFRAELSAEHVTKYRHVIEEYGTFVGKDSMTAAITDEHWQVVKSAAQ